jgi:uncharacterized membrane protein YedE/YeeE
MSPAGTGGAFVIGVFAVIFVSAIFLIFLISATVMLAIFVVIGVMLGIFLVLAVLVFTGLMLIGLGPIVMLRLGD